MVALGQAARARAKKAKAKAVVNKQLQFVMQAPQGQPRDYDYPIKYELWKTDLSKQSPEITVKIPIKVYAGAAAVEFWKSQGYSEDDFYKTAHVPKQPGVTGGTFSRSVQEAWSAKINKCWGKVGVLWRKDGGGEQLYSLKFEFLFVDDIAEAAAGVACVKTYGQAKLVNPTGTIDAIRWGAEDTDPDTFGPICHEVGHLIGNPDEYFTITYNGMRKNWGAGYQSGANVGIMNNPEKPPLVRYFKPLALELAAAFNIPVGEALVVEDVAMVASSKKHKLSDHIWD